MTYIARYLGYTIHAQAITVRSQCKPNEIPFLTESVLSVIAVIQNPSKDNLQAIKVKASEATRELSSLAPTRRFFAHGRQNELSKNLNQLANLIDPHADHVTESKPLLGS